MFMIKHETPDVLDAYAKVHFASTREIAEEIVADLSSRFQGTFEIHEDEDNYCTWDPGGMLMVDDEVFSFPLTHCTIKCKAQHFDMFVSQVQGYEPRGNKTKYIKIHGHWACICIAPEEYSQLKSLVNNPALAVRAEAAWNERERRLNKLAEQGDIARVVKGEDGKLYKVAPPNQEVDKKLLN